LIASGYTLSEDAIARARQIDEQNQISLKVGAAATAAREKISQIDQSYKITETVSGFAQNMTTKAREVDKNWHISENVQSVMKNIGDTVDILKDKAKESPVCTATVATLSQLTGTIITGYLVPSVEAVSLKAQELNQQFKEQAQLIKDESNQIYEENKRARTGSNESTPQQPTTPQQQQQQQNNEIDESNLNSNSNATDPEKEPLVNPQQENTTSNSDTQ